MKARRSYVSTPLFTRRLLSALLLCIFLISNCSFPVPVVPSIPEADSEVAYPCQHSHCGCKSARHCWTRCCCRTPRQRAEWAKENGVTPPSYAVVEDLAPSTAPSTANRADDLLHQVAKNTESLLTCGKVPNAPQQDKSRRATGIQSTRPVKFKQAKNTLVRRFRVQILAEECQGTSSVFTSLPWMSLPKAASTEIYESELCDAFPQLRLILEDVHQPPDTPPPRV